MSKSSAGSDVEVKVNTGTTPFIDSKTAAEAYEESYKWMRTYFQPVDEMERIARNKPSSAIDPSLPKVTDGTLASVIQESPKRIIQKLSTGLITCQDYPEYAAVADIIHRYRLLPMYNRMGRALQKDWSMQQQAMTYGRSCSYTFFTSTDGQLHTDFVIPYIKDTISERGKVYAPDSKISFMRSWYSKRDIQAIIDREQKLTSNQKGYASDWDLKLLADFLAAGASSKSADVQTPAEKEKGGDNGGFEVIHAFQQGKGAEFYSFSPRFQKGINLRTKLNKDPRGRIPLDYEYCNIDLSNPLGRGSVEISGGVQNLMDQQLQMFQFQSTYGQQPALKVWGSVGKASLKIRPNAIWDMGSNPTNKVERDDPDSAMMEQFTRNMQFLQSKIYNLNGSQDTSIPADANSVGQSKTDAGVKDQAARLGVSDNYLEKQHEAWKQAQTETSINVFFAEMKGSEDLDLSKEDIRMLNSTPAAKMVKDGQLKINYSQISDVTFRFRVDPSSSKEATDAEELSKLDETLKDLNTNGPTLSWYLGQDGKGFNIGEIYKQKFERLNLKNIDTILPDLSDEDAAKAKQAPFPIIDKPQFRVNTADLTAEQITAVLAEGGVNLPQPPGGAQPNTGMPAGLSPQGQADFIVEMAKAQAAAAPKPPSAPHPDELAIKQQEVDVKKQNADINAGKVALDVAKTAHDHTMEMHTALQPQPAPETEGPAEDRAEPAGAESAEAAPAIPQPPITPVTAPPLGGGDHPLNPHEQEVVKELFKRGFSEPDAEQAITMLRQGVPIAQIIKVLGAKQNA